MRRPSSINKNKINKGRRLFYPKDIYGCVVWLRSDLGVSLSSNIVTAWADQSGKLNNFSPTNSPTFTASNSSITNRPSINLNGTNQYFSIASNSTISLSTAVSCFVVHSGYGDASNNQAGLVSKRSTTTNYEFFGNGTGWNGTTQSGTPDNDATWKIRYFSYSTTQYNTFKNGTALTGSPFSSGIGATNAAALYVGASANTGEFLSGSIAEVILYNKVLSIPERNKVHRYLNMRYGISVTLS